MHVQGALAGAGASVRSSSAHITSAKSIRQNAASRAASAAVAERLHAQVALAERLHAQVAERQAERASRSRAAATEVAELAAARAAALAAARAAALAARAAALAAAEPDWVKPVAAYSLSAAFGESSGLWSHRHTGQDFAAPIGTPVRAAGDAKVVSAEWDGAYGRKIVLAHPDRTLTWYCHLSAFAAKPGDQVTAGDVIGRIGTTGNSTGPHLHLEVRPDGGDPVEPLAWLRKHGVKV